MRKILLAITLFVAAASLAINCKKTPSTPTDPCAGVTVSVITTKQDASAGQNNGSITVTSPTGSGVTYSINGGASVSNSQFTGLAAGTYTITAKNASGCSGTASVTIAAADPCAGKNITVSTPTIGGFTPCETNPDGSIVVNATGSTGFQYKIGTGAYQTNSTFTGLTAGNYTVFAKDADGCERSATATVPTKVAGTLFSAVRNIINTKCVSCHGAGGNSPNLTTDCSIVSFKTRIKIRCVDGTPSFMPQGGQLPASEKTAITNWINAGGRFSD